MKNILIACISAFEDSPSAKLYKYNADGMEISAKQTNEPCIKYLIKKLENSGEKLDHYICVQSEKVRENKTVGYLENAIKDFCNYPPEFFPCPLEKDEEDSHSFDKSLGVISQKILEIFENEEDKKVTIHLDMAGGKRDNYVFIQLLTKLLSFYGFEIHTYYADFDKEKGIGEIVNTDMSFKHMQILDAVNEFAHTGSVRSLRCCFENKLNKETNKLFNAMDEFSASVQLCSTDISQTYLNLEKLLNKVDKQPAKDRDALFVIKTMIPLIREKFGFENEENNIVKSGEQERTTLKVVKWCLDNNLIQQALTIYNEKTPDIIMGKKFAEIDEDLINITHGSSLHKECSDMIFTLLNNVFENLKNSDKRSRGADEELAKCKRSDNHQKQNIAAYFFAETLLPNGIKINISEDLFKKIMCDIRFAICTRNRVNHASDTGTCSGDTLALFRNYEPVYRSYKDENSFKPDNIKYDLLNAVNNIESALKFINDRKEQTV